MFAKVLIAASIALNTAQVDDTQLQQENSPVFRIRYPTGEIVRELPTLEGFGFIGKLQVRGRVYNAMDAMQQGDDPRVKYSDDGRIAAFPPVLMEFADGLALEVSRKIYVPPKLNPDGSSPNDSGAIDQAYAKGFRNYARYYDRIVNVSTIPAVVVVQFWGEVGLQDSTELGPRKDGWAIVQQHLTDDPWRLGVLFKRGVKDDLIAWTDSARQPGVAYFIPLPPGKSVGLVNFVLLTPAPEWPDELVVGDPVIAEVGPNDPLEEQLEDMGRHPDYDGLTDDEIRDIWNFYIDTDVNMDGVVNILDLLFVRNRLNQDPGSAGNERADVNQDYKINVLDLIAVRNDLGWPY